MSSWSAINSSKIDDVDNHETKEGVEYSLRSLYEGAINTMSKSVQTGDEPWTTAKYELLLLLENTCKLEDINKRKKLEYLALKNLSRVNEVELNFNGAMEYALNALDISPLDTDTPLLTRIAFLALQIGDKWTCQTLLFSGKLRAAMSSTLRELRGRLQMANASSDSVCTSVSSIQDIPRTTVDVAIAATDSDGVSSFPFSLCTLTSELIRICNDGISGAAFTTLLSNVPLQIIYEDCLKENETGSRDSGHIPSPVVIVETFALDSSNGIVNTDATTEREEQFITKISNSISSEFIPLRTDPTIISKHPRRLSRQTSASAPIATIHSTGENESVSEEISGSKLTSRRKSNRQVAKKLRDPEFDYSSTASKSVVGGEDAPAMWESCKSVVEDHLATFGICVDLSVNSISSGESRRRQELERAFLVDVCPHLAESLNEAREESNVDAQFSRDPVTSPFSNPFCPLEASSMIQLQTWQCLVSSCTQEILDPMAIASSFGVRRTDDIISRSELRPASTVDSFSPSLNTVRRDLQFWCTIESTLCLTDIPNRTTMSCEIIGDENLLAVKAAESWNDLKRILNPGSIVLLKQICAAYLSCVAASTCAFIASNSAVSNDEWVPCNMGSSSLRNAVILAWIALCTSNLDSSAVSLICHVMNDEEVVLIAECCVDIILQHQHGHMPLDDVSGRNIMRNGSYRALIMEYLAVCMLAWTNKGLFRSYDISQSSYGPTQLRMLWVCIQYTRFVYSVDAGLEESPSSKHRHLPLHNLCQLYTSRCNGDTLWLAHLGPSIPDCEICQRCVRNDALREMAPQVRSGLGAFIEEISENILASNEAPNECAEKSKERWATLWSRLGDYVHLPGNQAENTMCETIFQTGLVASDEVKNILTTCLGVGRAPPSIKHMELEALSRSKYAGALYLLYRLSLTSTNKALLLHVTNLVLAEMTLVIDRLRQEQMHQRIVDQLSLIGNILTCVCNCISNFVSVCQESTGNDEMTAAAYRVEILSCQVLLQSYSWKEFIVSLKMNATLPEHAEIDECLLHRLDNAVKHLCACAITLTLSKTNCLVSNSSDMSVIVQSVLVACCESDLLDVSSGVSHVSNVACILDMSPNIIEILHNYWMWKGNSTRGLDDWNLQYAQYMQIAYGLYLMRNTDHVASPLKVLSNDTAIYMKSPSNVSLIIMDENEPCAMHAPWRAGFTTIDPRIAATVVYRCYCWVFSALLKQYIPLSHEYISQRAEWVESAFTVLQTMYTEMSLRGLFHMDAGEFGKSLLIALSTLLTTTYYPHHQHLLTDAVHLAPDSSSMRILHFPSHIKVESFSCDSLTLIMTLLGQLCFDLYAFPLCTYYCKNKTDTLSIRLELNMLPFLLAFCRFCDDDMGVHASASRNAYNFLYTNIPDVMYPAKYYPSVGHCEERILRVLCDSNNDDDVGDIVNIGDLLGTDNPLHDVFQDLYDGLLKFGLADSCFAISSFPQRPSDSSESIQIYASHPFFIQNAEEVKNHAHIHLYLSHLSLRPFDVDVWFRFHDRLHELVCICLDDIGFNVYPPQNVPSGVKRLLMGSSESVVRVLCGTMKVQADTIYHEILGSMQSNDLMDVMKTNKVVWWDQHYSAASEAAQDCECESPLSPTDQQSISDTRKRRFMSCLDGIPSEYNDGIEKTGALSSLVGVGLVFAKLNELLSTSHRVLKVIHVLLHCDERDLMHGLCSPPVEFAQRYVALCEQRCMLLLTAAKLYHSDTHEYADWMHQAYLAACSGTNALAHGSLMNYHQCARGSEPPKHNYSSYFLPFVRGKTLWFLSGLAPPALWYLTIANAIVERSISVDKLDKRYRALVVCELHKIRLHMAMRLLAGISCGDRLPPGGDLPDAIISPEGAQGSIGYDGSMAAEEIVVCLEGSANPLVVNRRLSTEQGIVDDLSSHSSQSAKSSATEASLVVPRILCTSCGTCTSQVQSAEARHLAQKLCGVDFFQWIDRSNDTSTVDRTSILSGRLWKVVVDALRGLQSARQWDAYDFKSIFLISNFLLGVQGATLHPTLQWACPPENVRIELKEIGVDLSCASKLESESAALAEIHKLYRKRRPQVMAIWTHKNSPHRFDQYILYYWEVIGACKANSKALDLFAMIATAYSKEPSSAVLRWVMRSACLFFTDMYRNQLLLYTEQRCFDLISKIASEYFAATESNLSRSRCNCLDPPWVGEVYLDTMIRFKESMESSTPFGKDEHSEKEEDDEVFVSESQQLQGRKIGGDACEFGSSSSENYVHTGLSLTEAPSNVDTCLNTDQMDEGVIGENMSANDRDSIDDQKRDSGGVVSASAIVEWGLQQGWGSIAKKGKASGSSAYSSNASSKDNAVAVDGHVDARSFAEEVNTHVEDHMTEEATGGISVWIDDLTSQNVYGVEQDKILPVASNEHDGYVRYSDECDRPSNRTRNKRDRRVFLRGSSGVDDMLITAQEELGGLGTNEAEISPKKRG